MTERELRPFRANSNWLMQVSIVVALIFSARMLFEVSVIRPIFLNGKIAELIDEAAVKATMLLNGLSGVNALIGLLIVVIADQIFTHRYVKSPWAAITVRRGLIFTAGVAVMVQFFLFDFNRMMLRLMLAELSDPQQRLLVLGNFAVGGLILPALTGVSLCMLMRFVYEQALRSPKLSVRKYAPEMLCAAVIAVTEASRMGLGDWTAVASLFFGYLILACVYGHTRNFVMTFIIGLPLYLSLDKGITITSYTTLIVLGLMGVFLMFADGGRWFLPIESNKGGTHA